LSAQKKKISQKKKKKGGKKKQKNLRFVWFILPLLFVSRELETTRKDALQIKVEAGREKEKKTKQKTKQQQQSQNRTKEKEEVVVAVVSQVVSDCIAPSTAFIIVAASCGSSNLSPQLTWLESVHWCHSSPIER